MSRKDHSLLHAVNSGLQQLISGVMPALVQVGNGQGHGAGTIWHEDGLILTNAHVVTARTTSGFRRRSVQDDLTVTLQDGRRFPARLLALDQRRDLAALSIEAHELAAIPLGYSRRLRAGDLVVAVGHPWGILGAASVGAVIDVGRPNELPGYPGHLIQVGLQLRPGHSGGPLVDTSGQLVGISCMLAGPSVGLAIPVDVAKQFLQEKRAPSIRLA